MKICVPPLFLCIAIALSAQATEVEITAEPSHHQVLENAYVRVFKVEVPPKGATLMHWHRHDYFFVTLGATEVSNEVKGKAATTLKLADGDTRFAPGGFAHVARDLAGTPFRNVTIELLQDGRKSAAWEEERGLHILQGGTQEILMVKDGVRVSEFEVQAGGMVPKQQHTGPTLIVAVSDLELHRNMPEGMLMMQLKSGQVGWLDRGLAVDMMNAGKSPAKWVTFEFR